MCVAFHVWSIFLFTVPSSAMLVVRSDDIFLVCVCVCECACVYARKLMHVYTCTRGGQRLIMDVIYYCLAPYLLRKSLNESRAHQFSLTGWLESPKYKPISTSLVLGL